MPPAETLLPKDLQWFVLRDLKRPNSNTPAYKVLPEMGIEVFTPMHWVLKENQKGVKKRQYLPYIPSLLFALSTKSVLDRIVAKTETLQYQFVKGAPQNTPMVVPEDEMSRFIRATSSGGDCLYFTPEEIRPDMIGRNVIIKGGPLDGSQGRLLKITGTRKKRLIVGLRGFIVAAVEVAPEYIQLL